MSEPPTPSPSPRWFAEGELLGGAPVELRASLQEALEPVRFAPGELMMRFREPADHLLLLEEGEARVFRPDGPDGVEVELGRVGPGQTLGEQSFVVRGPRTASVVAATPTAGWRLPFSALDAALAAGPHAWGVYQTIARRMAEATARADEGRVAGAVELSLAAKLLITVISIQSGTLLLTGMMSALMKQVSSTTIMLVGYLLFITAIGVTYARSIRLPREAFGVTLSGWRPALREALLASAAVMLALVAVKWALVSWVPAYQGVPVFDVLDVTREHGRSDAEQLRVVGLSMLVYTLVGGFQELYARGMLQGQLYRFFSPRIEHPWPSILVSNLLFASIHVSWSASLTVFSFFGGLLWGWLYARRPTLLGPTVSHVLLGIWAGMALNVFALFRFGPLALGW
ncbi:MAG: cyclic nucleotide-binding domain-containing protein [Alphaproteobacteria bacterium]|nr:cyclic nucleotide-binding domain-containing protein [Alphaproteobacteria bacterium]